MPQAQDNSDRQQVQTVHEIVRAEMLKLAADLKKDDNQAHAHTIRHWVKTNISLIVGVLSLIVAGFAWLQPEWKSEADKQRRQLVKDVLEQDMKDRGLDDVQGDIKEIRGQLNVMDGFLKILAAKEMQQQAALPKESFEKQLPTLAVTASAARMVHAEVAPQAVSGIAHKLSISDPNSKDYWRAAGALVSYRSALNSGFILKPMRDCLDSERVALDYSTMIPGKADIRLYFSECRLDIDLDEQDRLLKFVGKAYSGLPPSITWHLELTDVHIVYRGGALLPIQSMALKNCTFEVFIQETAPRPAKALTQALLASDEQKIKVELPSA